jgi:small subunit ribosomal protein S11
MADEDTNTPAPEAEAAPVAAATPAAPAAPAAAPAAQAEEVAPKKDDKKRDIFAEIAGAEETQIKVHKAKGSKNISRGIVHVTATFNNTIVSVTDSNGNTLGWSSAGKMGFKGSRKSTAYAAQVVSQDACRQAMGPGSGRESAVRAVQALGIELLAIKDVTPIPHNGCRPKKARRV